VVWKEIKKLTESVRYDIIKIEKENKNFYKARQIKIKTKYEKIR